MRRSRSLAWCLSWSKSGRTGSCRVGVCGLDIRASFAMPAVRCFGRKGGSRWNLLSNGSSGGLSPARGREAPCAPQAEYPLRSQQSRNGVVFGALESALKIDGLESGRPVFNALPVGLRGLLVRAEHRLGGIGGMKLQPADPRSIKAFVAVAPNVVDCPVWPNHLCRILL